jgi:hypothetical protein
MHVKTPYYDWDGRKYMELQREDGGIVRVKVPFRYGRVACKVGGIRTVQELRAGEKVEVELVKKVWDGLEYWILNYICSLEAGT